MKFFGHEHNWQQLIHEAQNQSLAQAYLFYGPSGIGKQLVARTFVAYSFCEKIQNPQDTVSLFGDTEPKSQLPCGTCAACLKVSSNQHPDFFFLDGENETVKIDHVRSLQKRISMAPLEAKAKIVVINNINEMTTQAGNALLKTLEEPPANTYFILVASQLFSVLPTIRSRCRKLHFNPPPFETTLEWLKTQVEADSIGLKHVLEIAEGSPGYALKLYSDELNAFLDDCKTLTQGKASFTHIKQKVDEWVKADYDPADGLQFLKKNFFTKMVSSGDTNFMQKIELIEKTQKDMKRNVNKALALENLFLGLSS
ncbi:DNA polymerase III subunit delta' [bacterium]|nr:DNA polymerase III subunit delta' [bacterium]